MAWPIEFYETLEGSRPVEEFLRGLPRTQAAKVNAVITLLSKRGPTLGFPHSSQVIGKLRELRIQLGRGRIRVLYFFAPSRVGVLLHAFAKRTAKLPPQEINLALQRMADYLRRRGGRAMTKRRRKTNWDMYLEEQLKDPAFRTIFEQELMELHVGDQVLRLREKRGLTQGQLAAKVGTAAPNISRLEAGKANPTLRTLAKVAAALGAKVKVQLVEARS
ncbi:MAG: type II toxin-antitoxin system RelE/ParE family toxin [candidate division NC10 bacterium]|nr:type II toxin-antitoxin system RelE/ParE family toxin [candidate division NC10 bacterium]